MSESDGRLDLIRSALAAVDRGELYPDGAIRLASHMFGRLDEAWEEAEAVLPEGWTLIVGDWRAEPNRPDGLANFEAVAEPYVKLGDGSNMRIGRGDTPATALRQLAAAFRSYPPRDGFGEPG